MFKREFSEKEKIGQAEKKICNILEKTINSDKGCFILKNHSIIGIILLLKNCTTENEQELFLTRVLEVYRLQNEGIKESIMDILKKVDLCKTKTYKDLREELGDECSVWKLEKYKSKAEYYSNIIKFIDGYCREEYEKVGLFTEEEAKKNIDVLKKEIETLLQQEDNGEQLLK